jgi:hypothetical protein
MTPEDKRLIAEYINAEPESMTYKLDDDRRKLITEKLLGEKWHFLMSDPVCPEWSDCSCGARVLSTDAYHHSLNRTFDNNTDMMAVRKALRDKGKWWKFYLSVENANTYAPQKLMAYLDTEPERFCWLVSEWMKEVEK